MPTNTAEQLNPTPTPSSSQIDLRIGSKQTEVKLEDKVYSRFAPRQFLITFNSSPPSSSLSLSTLHLLTVVTSVQRLSKGRTREEGQSKYTDAMNAGNSASTIQISDVQGVETG